MMIPQVIRVSLGLAAALFVAALLKFFLLDFSAGKEGEASSLTVLMSSLGYVLAYALPLALVAAAATEYFRIRHVAAHVALGLAIALVGAKIAVIGEPLVSASFSGGALAGTSVLVAGILSGLAYWLLAGHHAGWQGQPAERADTMAVEAFRAASSNAQVEYCVHCLAGWSALGVVLYLLLSWLLIGVTGLSGGLVSETEARGRAVLKDAGYAWAKFEVDGDRGVVRGLAPDEVQKRVAYDTVRDALGSVTGFPGILSRVENETVSRVTSTTVSKQLADAEQREIEAKTAIEEARRAATGARAAEEEANRRAAAAAAKAAEAEKQRQLEIEQAAAEKAAPQPPDDGPPVELAAVDPAPRPEPAAGLDTSGQTEEDSPRSSSPVPSGTCTAQDIALIETTVLHFNTQMFDVPESSAADLDRVATSAKACAPQLILVSGVTDPGADTLFNPALGMQRAEEVRRELIERGVPATNVVARSNETQQFLKTVKYQENPANRKAEFRFLEPSEISRDATLEPDERAATCENDLSQIMSRSTIYFRTASARIDAESVGLIKDLAVAIEKCGSVIVTVEGHTDKIGDANYNQALSENRANTVRDSLILAGADQTRVQSKGFAAFAPHDSADTPEAFALNRRIEFRVTGKFTSTNAGGP